MERAAIAREIHDDVGGSLTALKFDLAWIARHASSPRGASRAWPVGARDRDARDRVQPAHHAQPAPGDPRAGPGARRCSGWRSRFERRTGVACQFRTATATARAAGRRAAGGLSHRARGAHQHQQARAGDARADRPVARRRRAVARGQRQRPRRRARTIWPRRAASASAACTSAPPRSAAGSTCRSGPHGTTLILSVPLDMPERSRRTRRPSPPDDGGRPAARGARPAEPIRGRPVEDRSAHDQRHSLRRPCADPARHSRHAVRRARHRGRRRGGRLRRAARADARARAADVLRARHQPARAAAASTCCTR